MPSRKFAISARWFLVREHLRAIILSGVCVLQHSRENNVDEQIDKKSPA
jgi:hypothetical protein